MWHHVARSERSELLLISAWTGFLFQSEAYPNLKNQRVEMLKLRNESTCRSAAAQSCTVPAPSLRLQVWFKAALDRKCFSTRRRGRTFPVGDGEDRCCA